jgi:hypothetical protein
MPCPTSQQVFIYAAGPEPVVTQVPANAQPVGIAVEPGDDVDFQFSAAFNCPVDLTLGVAALSFDPMNIFLVGETSAQWLTDAVAGEVHTNGIPAGSADDRRGIFENLVLFRTNVTQLSIPAETFDVTLPSGVYLVTFGATPTGMKGKTSYRWVTVFVVP